MGTSTSVRRAKLTAAAATAIAALALSACGDWRLETPPPSPSPAPADEVRRDAVAQSAAALVAAIDSDPTGAGVSAALDAGTLAAFESGAAQAHLDALGGIYVPFPVATPSPVPSTEPGPNAVDDAASALRDSALAESLAADDPSLALLLGAIGLSQALELERARFAATYAAWEAQPDPRDEPDRVPGAPPANPLAGLSDEDVEFEAPSRVAERVIYDPATAGDGTPFTTLLPGEGDVAALEAAGVSPATIDAVIAGHDRLNYTYELLRARIGPRVYRQAARARQDIHWRRSDALVAAVGRDPRAPAYELDRGALDSEEGMLALARGLEFELAEAYMAAHGEAVQAGESASAAWLLTAAFDAYLAAYTWWGGDEIEAEVFPGVDVSSPAN